MRTLPPFAAALLLLAVVITRGQQRPVPIPAMAQEQWAHQLAAALGNPAPSADLITFLVAWQRAEGGSAQHNPLNTTQRMSGSTSYNSVGVQNYRSPEDGLAATVATLQAGHAGYAAIVAGIQRNDPALALEGLAASPWGTSAALVAQIYGEQKPVPPAAPVVGRKSVVTETMEISAPYDSCGSGTVWAQIGQWGGCHLGVDFAGAGDTPVYAPYDCAYQQTGSYTGGATGGAYVICTITDRAGHQYQYYTGHLQDAIRAEPGALLQAGTFLGRTLGAPYNHTHVQLCGPRETITPRDMLGAGTPIACPTPDLYYKDFIAFYATH